MIIYININMVQVYFLKNKYWELVFKYKYSSIGTLIRLTVTTNNNKKSHSKV